MEEEPLVESNELIEKPKKPRSEKQLAAFEKARAKRVENAKIKHEKINEIKVKAKNMKLIDEEKLIDKPVEKSVIESEKPIIKKNKKKPKRTIIYQDDSTDSSSSDEELVILKSKAKTKNKEKKKVTNEIKEIEMPKVPIIKFV